MFGLRLLLRLYRENQAMRSALGWYAVLDHWRRRGKHAKGTRVRFEMAPAHIDRGHRARAVLARFPSRTYWAYSFLSRFERQPPAKRETASTQLPLSKGE
jgi:hypothetical protein